MFESIGRFMLERAKWKKRGKPLRNEQKIKELFAICSSNECQNYISKTESAGKCNICGCRLHITDLIMNKLAWSTTRCPLEEPKWIEEPGFENIQVSNEEAKEEVSKEEQEQKLEDSAPPPPPKRGGCGCGG